MAIAYRRSVGVSGEEIYKFGPNAGGIDECARWCREEENLRVVSQFEYTGRLPSRTSIEMRNDSKERRTHPIEMVVMQ